MWSSVFASQQYSMPMSQLVQTRSCGPCRLNVRFARKRTRLTPLADYGRSAWQAPLDRLYAAGRIAAARHDAEIAARQFECTGVDVCLLGRLFDFARLLGATCERVLEKLLRTLAALGRL